MSNPFVHDVLRPLGDPGHPLGDSNLDRYFDHMTRYNFAVAKEDWDEAYIQIEKARQYCLVLEAFPVLNKLKDQALRNAKPLTWVGWKLGLVKA